MTPILLHGDGVTVGDVVEVAGRERAVEADDAVMARLARARAALDRAAAGGQQIYGYNTGLGANLRAAVAPDAVDFQRQLLRGRAASVGDPLPKEIVRAAMFSRLSMMAVGGSGISPPVFSALVAMLNAGIHPVMPRFGSIGAGDLVLLTPIGLALIGEGEVEFRDRILPAADALRIARLTPCRLAPKDGLTLINASAVAAGCGALVVADALVALKRQTEAAALAMTGWGANLAILDPLIHAARPAPGQAEAAAALRDLLRTDAAAAPAALQDPLSFRCVPSVHGALIEAVGQARRAVELELNSAGDNPLVLAEEDHVVSTGNFHTPALTLAFQTLGLAIAQAADASVARFIQLTGAGRNGLPRYLSPVGGASAGFVPLQKTAVSILAALRQKAMPAMPNLAPVSEGVEDLAAHSLPAVEACAEAIDLWLRLVALEMLAAAQAVDCRGVDSPPALLPIHAAVRAIAAPLDQDRPLGRDAEAVYRWIKRGDQT